MFWGEFPMKPGDVASLPSHVVNGEVYGPLFDPAFHKQGIREMIYTSSQAGNARLFPDYFPGPASRRLHPDARVSNRIVETFRKISYDTARRDADLMGEINAGWADQGLHPETFWLGYATSASAGWHPGSPDLHESVSAFYTLYYGWDQSGMDRLYHLMSTQAQFWNDSWDAIPSTSRKGIWGYSNGIHQPRRPARDETIPLPPAPAAGLSYRSDWAEKNARRVQLTSESLAENEELLGLLHQNQKQVELNRYNIEVYLSIAALYRHNLEMVESIANVDAMLTTAAAAAEKNQPRQAVQSVDRAIDRARSVQWSRNRALRDIQQTWYKTWYPRIAEANGRKFLHELDDVKDHLPDRTTDMTYLILREMQLPFGEWVNQIQAARNQYAQAHQLPVRAGEFDWHDLKPISGMEIGAISLE
jgi:hexosaminidase